jgi:hypothetical protein
LPVWFILQYTYKVFFNFCSQKIFFLTLFVPLSINKSIFIVSTFNYFDLIYHISYNKYKNNAKS